MATSYPAYLELYESGELARRTQRAVESLADCVLCGRECHADRSQRVDRESYCHGGRQAYVSSVFPHHGEEACLRGTGGSGTIFFSRCNLRCVFCQNFDISWQEHGRPVQPEKLAGMMLDLQAHSCHNVNELANAEDYAAVACRAVKEMHRQVGDLVLDEAGLAHRGLLVRHLAMPGGLDDTHQIMRFLAGEISRDTFVNIMPQYRPEGLASQHPSINQPLTLTDYRRAVAIAKEEGLWRFDQR
ncbi:MAG: radical SAM protein [Planctomycetota bacterium]|jgi:uncharacterized Fe-S radical SAM superfamily protein PflX